MIVSKVNQFLPLAAVGLLFSGYTGAAPTADPPSGSGYDRPPAEVLDVMLAPSPPAPSLSPTGDTLMLESWQDYPSIERVALPYLRLAGVRVETGNHSKHDTPGGYGIKPCATGIDLVRVADGHATHVALPGNACADVPIWSADGQRFAFANTVTDAVELWIAEVGTGVAHRVPGVRLNPMLGYELHWMPDQKHLLVKLVSDALGAPTAVSSAPIGPSIQESDGGAGQSSTYETRDTLQNKHDEQLFDYYATSQIALVDAADDKIRPIGPAALYDQVEPAPDGQHLLVTAIHKPYSYVTTYDRFPNDVEVWDLAAPGALQVHRVATLPLADRVPIAGVRTGPRDFTWRGNEPATLIWAEALDGGDWKAKVPARDRVMMQRAPFPTAPTEVARTVQRFEGFQWSIDPKVALLYTYDENRHWLQTYVTNIDDPAATPALLWDRSRDEHYANPGEPVERQLPNGSWVLRQGGSSIFLAGVGSSPQGDRPFLDRLDLATRKSERLFRSSPNAYEKVLGFTAADNSRFLTWHQTAADPPNAFVRTLGATTDAAPGEALRTSTPTALTHLIDPTPVVRQIQKRLVHYKRADGLDLSFTLYTPPGYRQGTRVPTILYAYPLDYASASTAGQVTGSEATFTRLKNYRLMLLADYAIIDNASFPIIGDPRKAYDTYLDQLTADAKATVDEAVRLGVADPDRIGVTGHSHGALMTVNLVAHTDLFRAGVATSGSYNKTLTPFGFQNERRSVWEAPEVYQKVSPFFSADKLKTPLLLMHGAEDANPGTTPLQSSKLFEAIRGNGGTTRLVLLPHEPHWYTALESNEQLVYEEIRWFDKYVKNAAPRNPH